MSKQGFVDLRKNTHTTNPDSTFTRIQGHIDGNIRKIDESGIINNISTPWEISVETYSIIDPSTLTPVLWDRHIVQAGAIGDWAGEDQNIAQWNGTNWQFYSSLQSWVTYVKEFDTIYSFNGITWNKVGGGDVVGYTQTFVQADLTVGYLQISHNLHAKDNILHVTVKNQNGRKIEIDDIIYVNQDNTTLDLRMIEPITGTWTVLLTCIQETIIPVPPSIGKEINGSPINSGVLN